MNAEYWTLKLSRARDILSNTWLFGTLFRTGRKAYAGALYEFTYLFVWSILPFALGALTLYVTSNSGDKSFVDLGLSTFRNGELLVFTISMLAPILYLTLHDPEQANAFPHKLPISTAVALVVVASAALFALMKANAVKDTSFVFALSVVLTVLALIFRYLALVYHRHRMPPLDETALRSSQTSFVSDYGRHLHTAEPQTAEAFKNELSAHLGEHS